VGVYTGTSIGITRIVGTDITIITTLFGSRYTSTSSTLVSYRAGITIRTRHGVVGVYAVSSHGIAGIGGTHIAIVTTFLGTRNTGTCRALVVLCTSVVIVAG